MSGSSCSHPVAKIQDLVDRLKEYTHGTLREQRIETALWNELEDMLNMLVTPQTNLYSTSEIAALRLKAESYEAIMEIVLKDASNVDTHTEEG